MDALYWMALWLALSAGLTFFLVLLWRCVRLGFFRGRYRGQLGWLDRHRTRSNARLWLVGMLLLGLGGSWILGRPLLALTVLFLVPGGLILSAFYQRSRQRQELEHNAVVALHTVLGFVQSGMSLSAALFELTRDEGKGLFGEQLHRMLSGVERGAGVQQCLAQFRLRMRGMVFESGWRCLEQAYQNGLAIVPILENLIRLIEDETARRQYEQSLFKSAFVQGGIAAAVPWGVAAALAFFQPELWAQWRSSPYFYSAVLFCFLWQGLGATFLWKGIRFC